MVRRLLPAPGLRWSRRVLLPGTLVLVLLPVSPVVSQSRVSPGAEVISQELLAAADVLNRLMQANPSIDAPVSLAVHPFRSAGCAGQGSLPAGKPRTCLNSLDLPPALTQSFFVAYVFSLRAQSDPSTDPELASAVLTERTILLNTARAFPQGSAAVGSIACLISRELAAIRLGQLQHRQENFKRIDSQLATRIRSASGNAQSTQGKKELNLFLLSPLLMTLSKATSPGGANPMSDMLFRSAHWQILQQQAPTVAAALQPLGGVSEELALRTWRDIDGFIAFALQDRDALLAKQREQAQSEALTLLAMAGLDPRSCDPVFTPPPSVAELEAAMSLYGVARGRGAQPVPTLPRRFLSDPQMVVIHPRTTSLPPLHHLTPGPRSSPAPR